jgi:RNA polymerase sigma-70 factor (ECF subfamily)
VSSPFELEHLILQSGLGDRAAFSRLYDATSGKLFGICLRVLKDRAAAEDALQDSFVKIWNNAARYSANGLSPMTWLITISRNTAIDRLRAQHRRAETAELPETMDSKRPGPETNAIAASEARRITACLDELDSTHKAAVRGAYLEGDSYADLAARFDVPLNTMRTWLRRSLIRLRECMSR